VAFEKVAHVMVADRNGTRKLRSVNNDPLQFQYEEYGCI